jgi:hypothetical protein
VLLDSKAAISKKLAVAIDLGSAFNRARSGNLPNLAQPFDANGAGSDKDLAHTRDALISAVHKTVARSFRSSFVICALFALAAAAVGLIGRRRHE